VADIALEGGEREEEEEIEGKERQEKGKARKRGGKLLSIPSQRKSLFPYPINLARFKFISRVRKRKLERG